MGACAFAAVAVRICCEVLCLATLVTVPQAVLPIVVAVCVG
jgi:hypothetical protein